jgi:hypothetical protein
MMNIKDLNVTVTYTVSLSELEIPENVYNQIIESFDNNDEVSDVDYPDAYNWLTSNISERDSMDWSVEIDYISLNE